MALVKRNLGYQLRITEQEYQELFHGGVFNGDFIAGYLLSKFRSVEDPVRCEKCHQFIEEKDLSPNEGVMAHVECPKAKEEKKKEDGKA